MVLVDKWVLSFFFAVPFSKSYRDKSVLPVQIGCAGYFSFLAITVHGMLKVVGRGPGCTAHFLL